MKEEKEKSIKHFNSTAGDYDSSFDGKFVKVMYEPLLEALKKNIDGKLLDVGCGTGNILCELVNGKRELFGIDLSENMVRECSKRMEGNAEIKVADAEHMPYKDNFFDVLICNASFHHYPHPEEVLKEMKRVIKSGGKLFIGEGYAIQPFRALLNLSFNFSNSGDFKSYGKHEFIRMLEDNGFKIAEVRKTSNRTILYTAIA